LGAHKPALIIKKIQQTRREKPFFVLYDAGVIQNNFCHFWWRKISREENRIIPVPPTLF
jgi:hypothetical protein